MDFVRCRLCVCEILYYHPSIFIKDINKSLYNRQRNHKNGYYNGEVAYTGSDGVVQNKAYAPSRQYQVEFKAASTQDVSKIDVNPLVDPDGDQDHPHGDQDHPDADSNDAYHPDDDGHEVSRDDQTKVLEALINAMQCLAIGFKEL